jgi:hypothetical protein
MRIADATTCAAIALVIATAVVTTALAAEPHIVGREHNAMPEARVAVYTFRPVLANIDTLEAGK